MVANRATAGTLCGVKTTAPADHRLPTTPSAPAATPIAFVRAIVLAYEQRGLSPERALAQAQIAPQLLQDDSARITAWQMEQISDAAMQELDDEALGWFSRRLPWGSYGMLARASISSPTLQVALARGEVVEMGGDCFGDAVNVASRLCERAGPAEIWATETTVLLAGTAPDVWYRKLGMMDIRGKAELLMLYHVEWREDEAPDSLTMQAALVSNFAPVDSILGQIQFSWHGVDRTFTSSDAPVMVGRAEHAQLRINDPRVSRLHARIDWRNSGFVLTDMSSFGTWVRFEGSDSPVRLRRDACILHGAGHIALGVSFNEPSAPVMSFHVAGGSVHLS